MQANGATEKFFHLDIPKTGFLDEIGYLFRAMKILHRFRQVFVCAAILRQRADRAEARRLSRMLGEYVTADGALSGGDVFATCTEGMFDGFRFDTDGRLWTSAGDGVHCIDPSGALLGKIKLPSTVSNLTFGGRCRSRLFLCASQALFAIYTNQRGAQRPSRSS